MKTEQQRLEELLRANAFLSHIFNCINDGIILTDPEGKITFINPSAEHILGVDKERVLGRDAVDLPVGMYTLRGAELAKRNKPFDRSERTERDVAAQQVVLQRPDGKTTPLLFNVGRAEDDQMVAILTDITHLLEKQQQMEEYFNLVAHDLRSPLTAILGHAQLLESASPGSDDLEFSAQQIGQSGRQMLELVEGITERMRIEQGNFQLNPAEVNLNTLVQELVLQQAHDKIERRFVVEIPANLAVLADLGLMRRALGNLLTNAVKYSPEHSQVFVRAWESGRSVIVTVSDQGYGVENDDLPYIFDQFFVTEVGQKKGGVGLGLHIVLEIVKAHDGNLFVSSTPGEGTTFAVQLPQMG